MRPLLAVAVLTLCALCRASEAQPTALRLSAAGAQVADVITTQVALSRPGTREVNPLALANKPAAQVAVRAATILLVDWAARRLHKTGHPKAARRLLWAVTGGYTAVAVSNLRAAK